MEELKIRQTNLANKHCETGKFYPKSKTFFGLSAYVNLESGKAIEKLLNGETKFTVKCGIKNNVDVLYEVI